MPRNRQPKPTAQRRTWRDVPDTAHRSFPSWPRPLSLRPNELLTIAALCGDEESAAAIASFAPTFPVKVVGGAS